VSNRLEIFIAVFDATVATKPNYSLTIRQLRSGKRTDSLTTLATAVASRKHLTVNRLTLSGNSGIKKQTKSTDG